jgi:glutathione synthase
MSVAAPEPLPRRQNNGLAAAPLRVGFLMDPVETVRVDHDTTFCLMLAAQRRGHEVRYFEQRHLGLAAGRAQARMRTVELRPEASPHFRVLEERVAPLAELDVLFLRKDPPVDTEYIHSTQLVELSGSSRLFLVNSPAGLRNANEKLFALRFPEVTPPTLITRDPGEVLAFLKETKGEAVIKPVDGHGGKGVFYLRLDDPNWRTLVESATRHGSETVVVQQYLPASRTGDKRILLLNGSPIGAVLRVPPKGEFRCNMAAGGTAVATELTARDREICERLGPALQAQGLYLVGIDIIGQHLTEINVTSPTGMAEIDRLSGASPQEQVFDFVEERFESARAVSAGV